MSEGKKYTIELNEVEMTLVLKALGLRQQNAWDRKENAKPYEWLINKIYKSMGVKL